VAQQGYGFGDDQSWITYEETRPVLSLLEGQYGPAWAKVFKTLEALRVRHGAARLVVGFDS